jgi:hypothetical protein
MNAATIADALGDADTLPARLLQITEVWDALPIHPSAQAAITALLDPPAPVPRLRRLT